MSEAEDYRDVEYRKAEARRAELNRENRADEDDGTRDSDGYREGEAPAAAPEVDPDMQAALDELSDVLGDDADELDLAVVDRVSADMADGPISVDSDGLHLDLGVADDGAGGEKPIPPREVTAEDLQRLAEVELELNARWPETKIDPTLDRMQMAMDLLGQPQRSFPSIHVAGTNGKTTTTRMIESLMRAFHRRTGRTTSPHLQSVTERIAIDGKPIHPAEFVRHYEEIKPYIEFADEKSIADGGPRMSTFEVLTAMAYAAFADAPVEVGVVEVGMGGRWDATNVISADVAVICPIGIDHTDYLGETIEEIAAEKAGIIHSRWDTDDLLSPPENVAVIAPQEPAAMRIIAEQAQSVDAALARYGIEFGVISRSVAVGGQMVNIRGLGGDYEDIFIPLSGPYQAENAAVALAAVEAFFGAGVGRQLDIDTVRAGFAAVESPGRCERLRSTPPIFTDVAHNPHGAKALATTLTDDYDFRRVIGVLGIFGDKDALGVLQALEPVIDDVVITQSQSPRAYPYEDLAELARDVFGDERVFVGADVPTAIEVAVQLAEDSDFVAGTGIIVTGSVVTAGEARTVMGYDPS